nr:oxidoreductase [Saccharopolyspora sp. HNM0983]
MFDRLRRRRASGVRSADSADVDHLTGWAQQRRGVEGFLEPRTNVTETTLVLIAHDGEWTRRRVDGPEAAFKFTRKIGIPCYEVAKVGYPQRMRDYQARQRIMRKRSRERDLDDRSSG